MGTTLRMLLAVSMMVPLLGAEHDCALGERYYELAQQALAEDNDEGALTQLERATEACPTHQYWQERGEVVASLGDHRDAARAFARAYELASGPAQEARAVAMYAKLVFELGDVQRALVYVHHANNIHPGQEWITQLTEMVSESASRVERAHITRGLGDALVDPLVLKVAAGAASFAAATRVADADMSSLNVPINFLVGSTEVDEQTRANVAVLADELSSSAYEGRQFVIVGHADARGSNAYNTLLSANRAAAIFEQVVSLQPSLTSRIRVEGHGEDEPMALGTSENDHRVNRRLEVLMGPLAD